MSAQFVHIEREQMCVVARVVSPKLAEREAAILQSEIIDAARSLSPRVALDMTSVGFLASAGLGALISVHKHCKEAGGRLILFGLGEDTLNLLRVARLDKLLDIKLDRPAAIKALA